MLTSPETSAVKSETRLRRDHAGARLLLAEDNPVNREVILELLHAVGLIVETAEDGLQAVEKARTQSIDLILMDMQMPGLDGLTATQQIRAEPSLVLRRVPILAVTAMAMAGDRERCLAAGATDYLTKPVGLRRLEVIITRLLARATRPDR